ncbi:hypothetical protein HKX48_003005, partial [Thoreauomyces humboldtii]
MRISLAYAALIGCAATTCTYAAAVPLGSTVVAHPHPQHRNVTDAKHPIVTTNSTGDGAHPARNRTSDHPDALPKNVSTISVPSSVNVTAPALTTNATVPVGENGSTSVSFATGMGVNCAVCSFRSNKRFVFRSCNVAVPGEKMRPATSLDEWATFMGDGWQGHSICCDEDLDRTSQRRINVVTFRNGVLGNSTALIGIVSNASQEIFQNIPTAPTTADQAHVDRLSAAFLGAANVTASVGRRGAAARPLAVDVAPVCLPLVSKNAVGNPYHPSLVGGVVDVNLRQGQGFPVPLGIGRNCQPPEVPPCESTWQLTRSWTSSLSYSVNTGTQQSLTSTLGVTKTSGDENSAATSISDTLEQSVSKTQTSERGGSSSDTVADTLTKSTE